MACYYGKDSVVTTLVRGGANIDILDDIADTPIHWACWYLQMDAIKVLLAHGAKASLRNVDDETAMKKGVRACESRQNGKRLEQQFQGGVSGGRTPAAAAVGVRQAFIGWITPGGTALYWVRGWAWWRQSCGRRKCKSV
jgi:hypothetical protein